jgi:hypothetical protein
VVEAGALVPDLKEKLRLGLCGRGRRRRQRGRRRSWRGEEAAGERGRRKGRRVRGRRTRSGEKRRRVSGVFYTGVVKSIIILFF